MTVVPVIMVVDTTQAIIIKKRNVQPCCNPAGLSLCHRKFLRLSESAKRISQLGEARFFMENEGEDNIEKRGRNQLCHGNICGYGT